MPATTTDYSKIKEYQTEAASLTGQAGQYTAGSNVLGDKVMEAVRADRTSRGVSKLATDVGNVSGQMVTDPNAIREGPQSLSGQGLVDPFSVNALTSGARAQNLKTLGTVATQGLMNQGSIDEVIKAGADQLRAKAAAMLAKAEEASQMAISLQGDWERELEQKQFDENVRQFNETQKSKAGEGDSFSGGNAKGILGTYFEYLSPEDRVLFEAAVEKWAGMGLSDEQILSNAKAVYGKKRFTPEQTSTISSWSNPTKTKTTPYNSSSSAIEGIANTIGSWFKKPSSGGGKSW